MSDDVSIIIEPEVSPAAVTVENSAGAISAVIADDATEYAVTLEATVEEINVIVEPAPDEIGVIVVGDGSTPANPLTTDAALTGDLDGVNMEFTFPSAYVPGSTMVYINGLRQRRGVDFTETTATTITFSEPPISSDFLTADFYPA